MKVKMLIVSFLVMGFGIVLYGCSNKLSSENSYPFYTTKYLNAHYAVARKLSMKCIKAENSIGPDINEAVAFAKTTLGKDCTNLNSTGISLVMGDGGYASPTPPVPPSNVMPLANPKDSVLYGLPKNK